MSFLIVLGALCFLMLVAYRGYSVILFAPVAAMGAVLVATADAVGCTIMAPQEIPTGAGRALIGAPFFLYILRR